VKQTVRTLAVLATLVVLAGGRAPLVGQRQPESLAVNAVGASLGAWPGRVETMLREGRLTRGLQQQDTMLPGRIHERLSQRHQGLPVFGGQLVRQRAGSAVLSVSGRIFDNVAVPSITPAITAGDAAALAAADAGPGATAGPAELGVLPVPEGFVLVFRTTVRSRSDIKRYDVDATTGTVVSAISELHTQGIVGSGTGVLGDRKKVSVQFLNGAFHLIDRLRPGGPTTWAFDGSIGRLNSFLIGGTLFDADIARDSNNQWTDRAAVDAHVHSGWTQDYFFKRFGRQGLDNANFDMYVIVHPLSRSLQASVVPEDAALFINNALYFHPGQTMYGDGDGIIFDNFAGALDVVAHEWTHGVTGFSSGLNYVNESGALNEAFSDIMGTATEFMFLKQGQGPQKGPNFLIGEDVTRVAPGHIRSMQNPLSNGHPDHYSLRQFIGTNFDNGGIHINSSIVNHAYFLAVAGGTNRVSGMTVAGVGLANMAQMERIFYRAWVFRLGPLSTFADARAATLEAASELFGPGSHQRAQVAAAWTAVGVL